MAADGIRDGALCGRLRDPVPQPREKPNSALAQVQAMDGDSRTDAASDKTRIVDARNREASTFWGITSSGPDAGHAKKSLKKFKDTLRSKTRRTNGQSLQVIIADVNRTLRGWFEYFKHSHRTTFATSTAGFGCACGASCANGSGGKGRGRGCGSSIAGRMPSLPNRGCSLL